MANPLLGGIWDGLLSLFPSNLTIFAVLGGIALVILALEDARTNGSVVNGLTAFAGGLNKTANSLLGCGCFLVVVLGLMACLLFFSAVATSLSKLGPDARTPRRKEGATGKWELP